MHPLDLERAITRSRLRVRFCETDLMGIVHHAQYLTYFEAGRVDWLPAFSDALATSVMHSQIARHAILDVKRWSWGSRVLAAVARAYNRLKSILRM